MHKGTYNEHDTGPLTREDIELQGAHPRGGGVDRMGYEREGYIREGTDPRSHPDNRYGYDRDGYGNNRDYQGRDSARKPGDEFSRDVDYMETGDNSRQHDGANTGGLGRSTNGGGGLKKSASKATVDGLISEKMQSTLAPLGDEGDSDFEDVDLESEMCGKFDSGIESSDGDALQVMEEDDLLDTLEEEIDIYIPGSL